MSCVRALKSTIAELNLDSRQIRLNCQLFQFFKLKGRQVGKPWALRRNGLRRDVDSDCHLDRVVKFTQKTRFKFKLLLDPSNRLKCDDVILRTARLAENILGFSVDGA